MSKITQKKKAAKIKGFPPKTTKISVVDDAQTDITAEATPGDDWSRDSTSTSHYIRGVYVDQRYGDIECSFDVKPGKDYYLLYYTYGSGDSFGHDSGRIEFIALYDDERLAKKSYNAFAKAGSKGKNSVTIWNDLGQPYEEYIDQDYFGGFEGAYLETVRVIN